MFSCAKVLAKAFVDVLAQESLHRTSANACTCNEQPYIWAQLY